MKIKLQNYTQHTSNPGLFSLTHLLHLTLSPFSQPSQVALSPTTAIKPFYTLLTLAALDLTDLDHTPNHHYAPGLFPVLSILNIILVLNLSPFRRRTLALARGCGHSLWMSLLSPIPVMDMYLFLLPTLMLVPVQVPVLLHDLLLNPNPARVPRCGRGRTLTWSHTCPSSLTDLTPPPTPNPTPTLTPSQPPILTHLLTQILPSPSHRRKTQSYPSVVAMAISRRSTTTVLPLSLSPSISHINHRFRDPSIPPSRRRPLRRPQ